MNQTGVGNPPTTLKVDRLKAANCSQVTQAGVRYIGQSESNIPQVLQILEMGQPSVGDSRR
jgi:hypothetical protein